MSFGAMTNDRLNNNHGCDEHAQSQQLEHSSASVSAMNVDGMMGKNELGRRDEYREATEWTGPSA